MYNFLLGLGICSVLLNILMAIKLRRLLTDNLTGLPNRHALSDYVSQRKIRTSCLGVLFVDLDKLKKINDTYGHEIGDSYIKQVAEKLKQACRENDIAVRLGGDEFIVLLHNTDCSLAQIVADRIRRECAKIELPIPVSISIGIAIQENRTVPILDVIDLADKAMYKDKMKKKESDRR